MKTKTKNFWAIFMMILIISSFFLCGCKNTESANSDAEGSYFFQEVKLPLPAKAEKILDICVLEDGTLRIASADQNLNNLAVWDSKDKGETWAVQVDIKEKLSLSGDEFGWIYMDKGGNILCKLYDGMDNSYHTPSVYYMIDKDGIIRELSIQLNELTEEALNQLSHDHSHEEEDPNDAHEKAVFNGISTCEFISDSKLLISDYAGTGYLIDQNSGEILTTYPINQDGMNWIDDMESFDDLMIAVSPMGTLFYDLQSGQLTNNSKMELETAKAMEDMQNSTFLVTNQVQKSFDGGIFYYCNSAGIYQYTDGGTFEQIVNSKDISMSSPNLYMHSMEVVDETEFFLAMIDMDTYIDHLYRYTKTTDVSQAELTVWTLRESRDLQNAISLYRQQNPDVKIKVEVGMTGEDGVNVSDVISNLNAKLLSGNGPDVILLDQMPIQSYIEKGMLADLSAMIEDDDFYKNIINCYQVNEKLYAIPSRFSPLVIVGDEEVAEAAANLSDLINYAEQLKEDDSNVYLFTEDNFGDLNTFIFYSGLSSWMKKEGVDKQGLKEYLVQIKKIYELCNDPQEVTFSTDQSDGYLTMNIYQIANNNLKISNEFITDPYYQLSGFHALKKLIPSLEYTSVNNQVGNIYIPYSFIGASSQSSSLDLAKEFIAFSLSEQVQSQNNGAGNPVNRAALANTLDTDIEADMETKIGILHLTSLSDEQKKEFVDLVESLDTPVICDGVVMELVFEQVEEYIFGRITVDQAADNIMKKLSLYLKE